MHIKIWAKCKGTMKPEAICFSNHPIFLQTYSSHKVWLINWCIFFAGSTTEYSIHFFFSYPKLEGKNNNYMLYSYPNALQLSTLSSPWSILYSISGQQTWQHTTLLVKHYVCYVLLVPHSLFLYTDDLSLVYKKSNILFSESKMENGTKL